MAMLLAIVLLLAIGLALLWRRVTVLDGEVRALRHGAAAASPPLPRDVAEPTADEALPLRAPNPAPDASAPGLPRWRPSFDFEDIFGRLLPIWAGGVTLAVAGFFLVRWSIEAGLLTPPVRVVLAIVFGGAMVAAAEGAYRWRDRVADPRVAQALSGAGLATLYFAFYLAGSSYGLVAPVLAFVGLAGVTAAAIALSFRFGLPSAVLGLVGGFAAPALVGVEDASLPLLALYLALVTGGLTVTGRRQARPWLAYAGLAGGLGWGAILVGGDAVRAPDIAAIGAYLVVLGGIVPAFGGAGDAAARWARRAGAGIAALQLAVLVAGGGFSPLAWALYLLLGGTLAGFGWRDEGMREGSAVAAAVGAVLLALWPDPDPAMFAAVCAGLAAVGALPPLARLWRGTGSALDAGQAAGIGLGIAAASIWHFSTVLPDEPRVPISLALATAAMLPALAAAFAQRAGNAVGARGMLGAQAVAALVAYAALAQVFPRDALAWAAGLSVLFAAWRGPALTGAIAALVSLAALWALGPIGHWFVAGARAVGGVPLPASALPPVRDIILFVLPAAIAFAGWLALGVPTAGMRKGLAVLALAGAGIAAHVAFRHAFAAVAGTDFIATGVIQRAAWEAVLLTGGWAARARGRAAAAGALVAAALAHFAWFSLGLHNPLWDAQAVGRVPIANALVPMYAAGLAGIVLTVRLLRAAPQWTRAAADGAAMALIVLFALSEVRQAFAGSLPTGAPVGEVEDLVRSMAGIVLAIAFLAWGTRSGARSWRIGSLVLMVIAVMKVFLVDAAGLEGLARVASFLALGFSLIGIGWFYNRQLRLAPAAG